MTGANVPQATRHACVCVPFLHRKRSRRDFRPTATNTQTAVFMPMLQPIEIKAPRPQRTRQEKYVPTARGLIPASNELAKHTTSRCDNNENTQQKQKGEKKRKQLKTTEDGKKKKRKQKKLKQQNALQGCCWCDRKSLKGRALITLWTQPLYTVLRV